MAEYNALRLLHAHAPPVLAPEHLGLGVEEVHGTGEGRRLYEHRLNALFDSIRAAHDDRWHPEAAIGVQSPPADVLIDEYLATVRRRLCALVQQMADPRGRLGPATSYIHAFAILHEHWHLEDFWQARQTLAYPRPAPYMPPGGRLPVSLGGEVVVISPPPAASSPSPGDATPVAGGYAALQGGTLALGALQSEEFVLDSERWCVHVNVAPFRLARHVVTNFDLALFVDDGGYERPDLWSHEGWRWLAREARPRRRLPRYWQRHPRPARGCAVVQRFLVRRFGDPPTPPAPDEPACHLAWYEAEAYVRWIGAALPSEADWTLAAAGSSRRPQPWGSAAPTPDRANLDGLRGGLVAVNALPAGDSPEGCRQLCGNVWEWTSTTFYPFPGFTLDYPYRENTAPWFGSRKVCKGGAWATSSAVVRGNHKYRNFFPPGLDTPFIGLRPALAPAWPAGPGRVLFVTPSTEHGSVITGNAVTSGRIARGLAAEGMVVCLRTPEALGCLHGAQSPVSAAAGVRAAVAAIAPDVIICLHATKCAPLVAEACTAASRSGTALPYILVLGGTDVNVEARSGGEGAARVRAALRGAMRVVAFSPSLAAAARAVYPEEASAGPGAGLRLHIIPQGTELAKESAADLEYADAVVAAARNVGELPRKVFLLLAGLRPVKDVTFVAKVRSHAPAG